MGTVLKRSGGVVHARAVDPGWVRDGFLASGLLRVASLDRGPPASRSRLWRSECVALAKSPHEAESRLCRRKYSGAAAQKARTSPTRAPRHARAPGLRSVGARDE